MLRPHQEADGSRLPRCSFDDDVALQGLNHVVNRRRGNPEVALQIRLSRSLAVDLRVVVVKAKYWPCLTVNDGAIDGSSFGAGSIVTWKASSPKLSKTRTLRMQTCPPITVRTGFFAAAERSPRNSFASALELA